MIRKTKQEWRSMDGRFHVDSKVHRLFRELVDLSHSPFYRKEMKDVFVFAMAVGFSLNKRKSLEKRKDVADVDVFRPNERLLIESIAVKEKGKIEVLMDESEPIKIAEEFANGGIDTLYEWVFQTKEPPPKLLDKKITELVRVKKK
jgi:dnd system-associated protein 4